MQIVNKGTKIPNFYNMRGTSMLPTIRAGEGLFIDPDIAEQPPLAGDIVIYISPNGNGKKIVHRIIKACKNRYTTRGDNNHKADNDIVDQQSIVGKVIAIRRSDETIAVLNGSRGLWISRKLLLKKYCLLYVLKFPAIVSRLIEKSRILNIFHRMLKTQVIRIKKRNGFQDILLYQHKVIGKKNMYNGKWKIRFPYKYFINKKSIG